MLFLELLLANAQKLKLMVVNIRCRHKVSPIGRVGDVFADLTLRKGGDIFSKAPVLLGFEKDIGGGSLGSIT